MRAKSESTAGAASLAATSEELARARHSETRFPDPETIRIEQLQRSAAIGQVSEEIAHELRNSVGALRVLTDSFRSDPTPDRERLDVLDQGVEAILELVDSMIPSGSQTAATTLSQLLAASQALIRLVVPTRSPLEISFDPADGIVDLSWREFHQVLLNLVLNARDATAPDGMISIETKTLAHSVSLTVTDDGIGMDEETVGKIFDRYYTTKGGNGSGLGLAICRQIIERHGGRLTVTSKLGEGTSFTVILPRVA